MFGVKNKNVINCNDVTLIPKVSHWAIMTNKHGSEPGYDSGDPATSFTFVEYTAYLIKEEWVAEITKRTDKRLSGGYNSYNDTFVAMEVNPAVVTAAVNVSIS